MKLVAKRQLEPTMTKGMYPQIIRELLQGFSSTYCNLPTCPLVISSNHEIALPSLKLEFALDSCYVDVYYVDEPYDMPFVVLVHNELMAILHETEGKLNEVKVLLNIGSEITEGPATKIKYEVKFLKPLRLPRPCHRDTLESITSELQCDRIVPRFDGDAVPAVQAQASNTPGIQIMSFCTSEISFLNVNSTEEKESVMAYKDIAQVYQTYGIVQRLANVVRRKLESERNLEELKMMCSACPLLEYEKLCNQFEVITYNDHLAVLAKLRRRVRDFSDDEQELVSDMRAQEQKRKRKWELMDDIVATLQGMRKVAQNRQMSHVHRTELKSTPKKQFYLADTPTKRSRNVLLANGGTDYERVDTPTKRARFEGLSTPKRDDRAVPECGAAHTPPSMKESPVRPAQASSPSNQSANCIEIERGTGQQMLCWDDVLELACDSIATKSLLHDASSLDLNGFRPVIAPRGLVTKFIQMAHTNTARNVETCGLICGTQYEGVFIVTDLLIPRQRGTSDTCEMIDDDDLEMFEFMTGNDLLTLGWIHTHPTQSLFLSAVDLHTHCSYQLQLPEAIAVVYSPKFNQCRTFNLTPSSGLDVVSKCPRRGFHAHQSYEDLVQDSEHVVYTDELPITVTDFRAVVEDETSF